VANFTAEHAESAKDDSGVKTSRVLGDLGGEMRSEFFFGNIFTIIM
jgi:hypothetical protein